MVAGLTRCALLLILLTPGYVSPTSLFDDDAVLEIRLSGRLNTVVEQPQARVELPFMLGVGGIDHSVSVRARGKSRLRVCSFPPLRLEFPADVAESSPFAGQHRLKLVTHCSRGRRAAVDTLEEYAAYRIFHTLSDIGLRVRLLRISYEDTDAELTFEPGGHFGFLIESVDELAARAGGEPVRLDGVTLSSLNNRQAALVYVFQYLIGNTDWSFATASDDDACCHNVELLTIANELSVVPYDFDQAGLVNARYARPDASLRISRVTRRLYRGYCIPTQALEQAVDATIARKDDILGVVEQLPGLAQSERRRSARFLEKYFELAADPASLVRDFEKRCL